MTDQRLTLKCSVHGCKRDAEEIIVWSATRHQPVCTYHAEQLAHSVSQQSGAGYDVIRPQDYTALRIAQATKWS